MGAETVIHGGGQRSGVARGLHVYLGIPDEKGIVRRGCEFAQNGVGAQRIRFFCFKAVTAVDGAKIFREAQALENTDADAHRLVRQDGHRISGEMFERFGHARVGAGIVHFVIFVITQEKFKRALAILAGGTFTQSLSDELGRTATDIASDGVLVKFFATHFPQHGVDGENQVALGIDECAVEVENQRAHGRKFWGSHELDIVIRLHPSGGHTSHSKFT